jgi:hypothetical protein
MSEIKKDPVFTQEMVNDGCQVERGMRFMTEAGEYVALFTNIKSVCFADEHGFLIAINRAYAKPIPTPINLIEGNAYKFDCDDHIDVIGLFSKCGGLFLIYDGAVFNSCFCTNIRPMAVVEEVSKTDE